MKDSLRSERSSEYRVGPSFPLTFPLTNCVKKQEFGGGSVSPNGLLSVSSCLMVRKQFQNAPTFRKEGSFCSKLSKATLVAMKTESVQRTSLHYAPVGSHGPSQPANSMSGPAFPKLRSSLEPSVNPLPLPVAYLL